MLSRAELLGQWWPITRLRLLFPVLTERQRQLLCSLVLHGRWKDPTISVGGILKAIGGNIRVNSDVFVTEACEYTNSFCISFQRLNYPERRRRPYGFLQRYWWYLNSFHQFAALLLQMALVINQNIEGINSITDGLDCKIITYSERQPADYSASEIPFDEIGNASFDLLRHGEYVDRTHLPLPVTTSQCIQCTCRHCCLWAAEIPLDIIKKGFCRSPERTAVSNMYKVRWCYDHRWLRIIQRRSAH